MDPKVLREKIIQAGYIAVEELIKVAKEDIIKVNHDDDLSADKLKNAAASKRLAIFDAFEILAKVETERNILEGNDKGTESVEKKQGWAERRAK
jgi:hypothetical protein